MYEEGEREAAADTGGESSGYGRVVTEITGQSFIEIWDLVFEYRRESDSDGEPDVVMRALDGESL
jgi:alanyl-tRNA synthetase